MPVAPKLAEQQQAVGKKGKKGKKGKHQEEEEEQGEEVTSFEELQVTQKEIAKIMKDRAARSYFSLDSLELVSHLHTPFPASFWGLLSGTNGFLFSFFAHDREAMRQSSSPCLEPPQRWHPQEPSGCQSPPLIAGSSS